MPGRCSAYIKTDEPVFNEGVPIMNVKQVFSIPVLCAGLVLSGQALAESVMHSGPDGTVKYYPSHDSSNKTTQRYAHLASDNLRVASNRVSDLVTAST